MTLTVQLIRNGEECFPYHNIDIWYYFDLNSPKSAPGDWMEYVALDSMAMTEWRNQLSVVHISAAPIMGYVEQRMSIAVAMAVWTTVLVSPVVFRTWWP